MKEKVYEKMLLFCAMASTLVVVLVGLFVFLQGYPLIAKTGFISFVFGKEWLPGGGVLGSSPW